MLIQDRIKLIIKANNESSSSFADKIGINRSNLSHVLSGRNKPSFDFLSKILLSYPKVNASWLITGDAREDEKPSVEVTSVKKQHNDGISSPERTVDRIVVFYSDGTFSTYTPNEQ